MRSLVRSTFGTVALLGIAHSMPGQSKTERAQVEWGEARDSKEHGEFNDVVYKTDDHIYVTVTRKKETWLQLFRNDLRLVKEIALPLEMGKDDHDWEKLLFLDDRILFFTTLYRKDEKNTTLFVREYGLTDLASKRSMLKLRTIPAESRKDRGSFVVTKRPAGKGVKIVEWPAGQEGVNRKRKVLLYDENMQMEDESIEAFELPYDSEEYDEETSITDDDGTIVMVVRKYPEKREKRARKREGKPTFDFVLVIYPPGMSKPQLHPINVQDKFLQDIRIRIPQESGDILCAGFYGNKGSWSVRGAFFLKLDRKTKEIVHQSFKEFDKEFITAFMTAKEEKKATKKADKKGEDLELYEYDLNEIVLRDDGGAILVGEQYYSYVETSSTIDAQGRTISRTYIYHYIYNDIIVISSDPAGNIEWAVKVPKRQHTSTTGNDTGYYSSYALAVKNDHVYLVFNDNGKNLFLKQGMKVEQFDLRGKEALITLVTVDGDGAVHREALLAPDKRDAILRPKSCFQMEDGRMFIYATRKKEYRYGTISFD